MWLSFRSAFLIWAVLAPRAAFAEDTSLAARLDRVKAAGGDVLLLAGPQGIEAYTADLIPVARLTGTPARYPMPDVRRDRRLVYFLAQKSRQLVQLDLTSGTQRALATLPLLRHRCFDDGQAANPLDFIQSHDDVSVNAEEGYACLKVQDRNDNMASIALNYRIDLASGKVKRRYTLLSDECREKHEREGKTLCETYAPAPARPGRTGKWPYAETALGYEEAGDASPSGRWAFLPDHDLGEEGDYIYSAPFFFDRQTGRAYAVEPGALRMVDLALLKKEGHRPDRMCLFPGEAIARWLTGSDVFLLGSCSGVPLPDGWAGGPLLIRPPDRPRQVPATDVAIY